MSNCKCSNKNDKYNNNDEGSCDKELNHKHGCDCGSDNCECDCDCDCSHEHDENEFGDLEDEFGDLEDEFGDLEETYNDSDWEDDNLLDDYDDEKVKKEPETWQEVLQEELYESEDDYCDLDSKKICDNCGKCIQQMIESRINDKGFAEIPIDKVTLDKISYDDFIKSVGLDDDKDEDI